jgi:hypothetical protein
MGTEYRCAGCGAASDEQHRIDCTEYAKSRPLDTATHWRREAERFKVRGDELEKRLGEVLGHELPDLGVELRRLEALVQAYQAMSGDAERRRAMNYLLDRFRVAKDGPPGGMIFGPIQVEGGGKHA